MSLPRYPEYKDSEVEWLGEVPNHWTPSRFKWLIERNDGGVWGDDPDGADDTIVLRSTEQTVDGRWRIDEPAFRKLAPRDRDFALLGIGDLLVTKSSGSSLHIGKTTLVDEHVAALGACYSNFMQRVRVSKRLHPKLAWYLLNSELSRLQLAFLSNSTTGLANLNGTIIGELLLAVQPQEEQERIVAFLDRETGKIDALIAEQEKLLALLAEKRQVTISHAVTRGLDPNVAMKDSGIDWLGEIPVHWQSVALGRLCAQVSDGPHFSPSYVEEGVLFLSARNIRVDGWSFDDVKYVSDADYDEFSKRVVPEVGDVLYTKGGTTGVARVVDFSERFQVWVHVAVLKLRQAIANPHYVAYALNSRGCYEQSQLYTRGATNQDLGLTRMVKILLALPPIEEQTSIVSKLDGEVAMLDTLKREAERVIQLLTARRSSLIAAAVTGQIDVRGLVEAQAA